MYDSRLRAIRLERPAVRSLAAKRRIHRTPICRRAGRIGVPDDPVDQPRLETLEKVGRGSPRRRHERHSGEHTAGKHKPSPPPFKRPHNNSLHDLLISGTMAWAGRFAKRHLRRDQSEALLNLFQVVLVALRQARPRGADGMGHPGRPLRRSTRRSSPQRDEFHRREVSRALQQNAVRPLSYILTGLRLACIFHTCRSRRREEADGPGVGTSPPPNVGGYGLWAFHARCEISGLAARSKTPGAAVAAVCDRRISAKTCARFGAHRAPLQFLNGLLGAVSISSRVLNVIRPDEVSGSSIRTKS